MKRKDLENKEYFDSNLGMARICWTDGRKVDIENVDEKIDNDDFGNAHERNIEECIYDFLEFDDYFELYIHNHENVTQKELQTKYEEILRNNGFIECEKYGESKYRKIHTGRKNIGYLTYSKYETISFELDKWYDGREKYSTRFEEAKEKLFIEDIRIFEIETKGLIRHEGKFATADSFRIIKEIKKDEHEEYLEKENFVIELKNQFELPE